MNNLFASWHAGRRAEIDLAGDLETIELLSRAHDRLGKIPELSVAQRLVGVALNHVVEWLDLVDAAERRTVMSPMAVSAPTSTVCSPGAGRSAAPSSLRTVPKRVPRSSQAATPPATPASTDPMAVSAMSRWSPP